MQVHRRGLEVAPSLFDAPRRIHTGRIVTVTNDKLFEEPVFDYTREFPITT